MNSSGHRNNILGSTWRVIGVGAYEGSTGKKMWTVLFAQPCSSPAPAPKAQQASRPTPRATSAGEWPEGTSKTFLLRWGKNPELPALLAEVAELEDRTQQKTALRALQRGLEVIRAEHKG